MQSGDIDLSNTLQKELNQIKADIERNETSIFDDKNKNKDKYSWREIFPPSLKFKTSFYEVGQVCPTYCC